jgi:hypothetical protein
MHRGGRPVVTSAPKIKLSLDRTHALEDIRLKACDGQLVGPNSTVGNFGMQLGSDWAIINPDPSGLGGCFFRVGTSVGRTILANCVVGHRCLVAGGVQGVRGAIGNNLGGPAVDVLTQIITAVDITIIEEQAIKSCRNKD